jgi:ArsR family transcriptional regulator
MNDASPLPDESIPPEVFEALRTIAEPSRARVIELLGHGECCVCDLGSALGLSPALASHHLKVLRSSGLIRERRAGRWVYYSLDLDRLEQLRLWIDRLLTPTSGAATTDARPDCAQDPTPVRRPFGRPGIEARPMETR